MRRNDDTDPTRPSTVTGERTTDEHTTGERTTDEHTTGESAPDPATAEPTAVAFVCVRNAGRSQMATAYAERERADRGLEDAVRIVSGGTDPADAVHDVVVEAMAVDGFHLEDRQPREVTPDELAACDVVCTMGCSAEGICPATWRGDDRDWELPDPHGKSIDAVHEIREQIRARVSALFDELER